MDRAGDGAAALRPAEGRDRAEGIYTKLYQIPVTVPPDQSNVVFTHVEEDMTVPMPSAIEFDDYVIYVGYDPQGASRRSKKKPPARPAKPSEAAGKDNKTRADRGRARFYQPRSSTTVLLSMRKSGMTVLAPAASTCPQAVARRDSRQ